MWIPIAAVSGLLAVAAGAFGAHGLKARLEPDQLGAWSTASQYHLLHSILLVALALYGRAAERSIDLPASLLLAGIVLFSGSIYWLLLGGPRALGPVTPIGGLCLMAGWLSLITLWHR